MVLEGTFTLFEDMDGTVGESRPGSLTWNGYDGEFGGRATMRRAITPRDDVEIEFAPEAMGGAPLRHLMCAIPGGVRVEFVAPAEA